MVIKKKKQSTVINAACVQPSLCLAILVISYKLEALVSN